MAGIDLTGARATFEELVMSDDCAITHNPNGRRDTTINDATGALEGEVAEPITVYEGKCSVRELQARDAEVAGLPKSVKGFRVNLPVSAPEIEIGDVVTLTTSQDPLLVGESLVVVNVRWTTLQVARRLTCIRRLDAVDSR